MSASAMSVALPAELESRVVDTEPILHKCYACLRDTDEFNMIKIVTAKPGTQQVDSWLCRPCKRLKERLNKMKHQVEGYAEFEDESKENRAEFFINCHALMGPELKMAMKEVITKIAIKHHNYNFSGKGAFLDEHQLEKKYAGYPNAQLIIANIKENANTITCPLKNTPLYEDMEYASVQNSGWSHEEKRAREASTEENAPAAKKPKAKAKAKTRPDAGGGEDGGACADGAAAGKVAKELKPTQKRQLEALIKQIKLTLDDLRQNKGLSEDTRITDNLANNLKNNIPLRKAELDAAKSELEFFLEENNSDKIKDQKEKTNESIAECKKFIIKLETEINKAVEEVGLEWDCEEVTDEELGEICVWKIVQTEVDESSSSGGSDEKEE